MHILLVAPSAPPKNGPEAMQVGRLLAALDPAIGVTLVTTPVTSGWERHDDSLAITRPGLTVVTAELPFHRLTQRVLANRRLSFLHMPDSDFWLTWMSRQILRRLPALPDVIYSRSAPFSGALLAYYLKARIGCPWLMHLSDPWAGSPYRAFPPHKLDKDNRLEALCIEAADLITVTTPGQAEFYRAKYPQRRAAIEVSPNMMPVAQQTVPVTQQAGSLRLVYTGAIYQQRNPKTLLRAIQMMHQTAPEEAAEVRVEFYGNIDPAIAQAINATPGCAAHAPTSFADVTQIQACADVLVTIEPSGDHPLLLHFMPSKNLDYIAAGKPLLAITPEGSVTDRFCRSGHGWSVAPGDDAGLASILTKLASAKKAGKPLSEQPDLSASPYQASVVAADIAAKLDELVGDQAR